MLPYVTHAYLSPPESTTQMASQSVQPFLHSSQQSVVTHVGACPSPLKIAPSHGASGPASDTWFFGSILLIIPKGISISSAVFAQLTIMRDRLTDQATWTVTIGRIYVVMHSATLAKTMTFS